MAGGLWQKVRGALGLMAMGGVLGSIFGVAWAIGISFFATGVTVMEVLPILSMIGVMVWGTLGAIGAVGVAGYVAAGVRGGSIADVSAWKAALVAGGLTGLFPLTMLLGTGFAALTGPVTLAALFSAGFGGIIGGGMVRMAKRAELQELGAVDAMKQIE